MKNLGLKKGDTSFKRMFSIYKLNRIYPSNSVKLQRLRPIIEDLCDTLRRDLWWQDTGLPVSIEGYTDCTSIEGSILFLKERESMIL